MPLNDEVEAKVLKAYKLDKKLGEGSYGVVWRCTCKKTNEVQALKKQVGAFRNAQDAQRTMREILLLHKLRGKSPHILNLFRIIRSQNDRDLYFVTDCMDCDLSRFAKRSARPSDQEYAKIVYQMLQGLACMHAHGCLHRDIKPANILFKEEGHVVKLGDFGLARTLVSLEHEEQLDPEDVRNSTTSLWYMAPETILGSQVFSKPADVWAVGCVMGEVMAGRVLFRGGSKNEMLAAITQLVGTPPAAYTKQLEDSGNLPAALTIERLPRVDAVDMRGELPDASAEAVSLLKALLEFIPEQRITARAALEHPWFKQVAAEATPDPGMADECRLELPLDDSTLRGVDEYRDLVYREIDEMCAEDGTASGCFACFGRRKAAKVHP